MGAPGERASWESREVAKVTVVKGVEVGRGRSLGGRWDSRKARSSAGKWRTSLGEDMLRGAQVGLTRTVGLV